MAVVRVGERKGRRGTSEGEDGVRTHQRVFYVKTDSDIDHGDAVLDAPGLPQLNEQHPTDFSYIVMGRIPREIAGAKGQWEVDIEYGQRPPSEPPGSQGGQQKLLLRDPQISVGFQNMLVPITGEAVGGEPDSYNPGAGRNASRIGLTNAAGEPFDPPAMRQKSSLIITITRSEATFNNDNALRFIDSVNNAAISIAGFDLGERTAKMMGISTPGIAWETFESVQFFTYPVTYTIHVNVETWDIKLLEHGTYYNDFGDGGKKKAFLTDEGQPRIGLLTEGGDDNGDNPGIFHTVQGFPYKENWGAIDPPLPSTMLPVIAQGGQPGAAAGEGAGAGDAGAQGGAAAGERR